MSNMQVSKLGDIFTKQNEGLELKIYHDAKSKDTVGYGHKIILPADQWIIDQNGVITQDQAEELYNFDKFYVEVYLNNVIFVNWLMRPTQWEFDGLADFSFQYGTSLQTRFPDSFNIFRSGDRGKIVYALQNWFNNVDPKQDDDLLVPRRQREVALFRDGKYS